MVFRKLDIHLQRNETGHLSHTIQQINSKRIEDLNIRPQTKKLLEENIEKKLLDIGLGIDLLDMTSKAQALKQKLSSEFPSN